VTSPHQTTRDLIANANRILLLTHVSPDGDAIGSLLGLYWALKAAGKEALPVSPDGCPEVFRFLPASADIVNKLKGEFDLSIVLDCADLGRAGKPGEGLSPDLNIDHHATNPRFGRLNFVESDRASTAELLAELLPGFNLPLTKEVAECLLCGVVSDTLGFSTANTNAKVLTTAQTLMAAGADLPRIYDYALNRRSFASARLWGQGLGRASLADRIAWTTLTLADKQAIGYNGKGDADLINVLTTINDADIFVIFVEYENNEVKISWRARPGWDVSKIAQSFGGGGHVSAAGANLKNISLAEAEEKVLAATRQMMNSK
jgi:phosphoesterase RecJ-like protein